MADAFILSAARTPIGKYLGSLAELSAPQLGAVAVVMVRSGAWMVTGTETTLPLLSLCPWPWVASVTNSK